MIPAWQARHLLTFAQYQPDFDALKAQGYRPLDLNAYSINGEDHFASVWEQSPGPAWEARHDLSSDAHNALFRTLPQQGFRPISISGYDKFGEPRFASLWQKVGGAAVEARHGLTSAEYQTLFDAMKARGFRPVDICGYQDRGQVRFAAIFDNSPMPEWVARHDLPLGRYLAERAHWEAHGFGLRRVSGYDAAGETRYAAIWTKGPAVTWQSRQGLSSADYQAEFNQLAGRGYRLVKLNGYTAGGRTQYAGIWHKPYLSADDEDFIRQTMTTFMNAHGVPGASLARTVDGRLVFAAGYGVTDPSTSTPVTTGHLFRVASVSKPITAATVFRLIDQGRVNLTDRVLGGNGLLGTTFGTQPYAAGVDQITVQHLLEHTSGWAQSQDPMFGHLDLTQAELISWMLDRDTNGQHHAPLTHSPGTTFEYLNFGYCLLGRVIEAVTGTTYAEAVRQLVLQPSGVTDMHIAGDTLADRRSNEVTYRQQGSVSPYGVRVSRMDAHGGWIASPTDLLRFLVHVDGFVPPSDVLSAGSVAAMYTQTTAPTTGGTTATYARGWATHASGNRFHFGDIPGTAAILVRSQDRTGWALVVNSRNDAQLDPMRADLDQIRRTVESRITDWPMVDLF